MPLAQLEYVKLFVFFLKFIYFQDKKCVNVVKTDVPTWSKRKSRYWEVSTDIGIGIGTDIQI